MDGFIENPYFWAQFFGFCAMICSIIAWQLKNPRHILMCYIPGGCLWALQFLMLGAFVGVGISIISSFKDSFIAFINKKHVSKVIIGYLAVCFIIVIFNTEIFIDVMPFMAMLVLNIPLLQRENRALFARGCLLSQLCWFVYNCHYGAYMGMACGTLLSISCLIGMARYEGWQIGKCYRSFVPSIGRALFNLTPRTFP